MGIVRYKMDLNNPPKMTDEELARIDAIRDEDIDYSDIPEMDYEFFKTAKLLTLPELIKQQTTLRIDGDVLAWFKEQGRGYQTRMNAVLRAYMLSQKKG